MSSWLRPVLDALDALDSLEASDALATIDQPATVFFRDDDAGWDDAALWRLLDVFTTHGVPIDVAVIPDAIAGASVDRLLDARHAGVRVHQHGRGHHNHERLGRKCEFGPSRSPAERRSDVIAGQERLRALFGEHLDPIFTPPWNRCDADIVDHLDACGIAVLSRDASAGRIDAPTIVEVPVDVDWFRTQNGRRISPGQLADDISAAIGHRRRAGIMLHHAVTDRDDLTAIAETVDLLARHDAVRCTSIMEVASLAR